MEIRSFLAFELPKEIKAVVSEVSENLGNSPFDIRRLKVENIHLTMVFLGSVHEEDIHPIGQATEEICIQFSPFNVSLRGAGFFGSRKKPSILWVGLDGHIERMARFRDALQRELAPFGIKEEKRGFRPHLTIGRFRRGSRSDEHLDKFVSRYGDLTSPTCNLGRLVLFRSDLNRSGAVYSKLNSWPLTGKH